jgi:hypothetical protein
MNLGKDRLVWAKYPYLKVAIAPFYSKLPKDISSEETTQAGWAKRACPSNSCLLKWTRAMPFVHPTATNLDTFCRFGYLSKYLPRATYQAIDVICHCHTAG